MVHGKDIKKIEELIVSKTSPMPNHIRPRILERSTDSGRSMPSSCCPRLLSVSVTVRAFLESQMVTTMTPPAIRSRNVCVGTFLASMPMVTVSGASVAMAAT